MDQVMDTLVAVAIEQASLDGGRWDDARCHEALRSPRRARLGHNSARLHQVAGPHRAAPLRLAGPSPASLIRLGSASCSSLIWIAVEERPRLGELITPLPLDTSALSDLLFDHDRFLWRSDQACWKYSETLNAVTSKRRELRPLLGRAWDVAWTWTAVEPIDHNFGWPRTATLPLGENY